LIRELLCQGHIKVAESEIVDFRARNGFVNSKGEHVDFFGELKWTKVSKRYLHVYKGLVDIAFEWIDKDIVRFNLIMLDTQDPAVVTFGNIAEEGYFKLLYQLYYQNSKTPGIYKIYPDSITNPVQAKLNLDTLQRCLEPGFNRRFSALLNPSEAVAVKAFVHNITPVDSKSTPFIQVVDVLMGAIGYLQNGLFRRPEANAAKIELMKYIFEKIVLSGGIKVEGKKYYLAQSKKFNIWMFKPHKKSS
jgi:hypothetical protein